jgi:hypothetical protein
MKYHFQHNIRAREYIRPPPQYLGMFNNNEEVEMAVLEWLQVQEPYLCRDGIFKPVPIWDECVMGIEDYVYKVVRRQRKN